jgi:hypothetical protein
MSVIYKLAVTSSANDVTVGLRKGKAKEKRVRIKMNELDRYVPPWLVASPQWRR